jgi:anti-sigma B factor antagonist/stage II sporulation protein AA (anti-sigma F factor antagonist)
MDAPKSETEERGMMDLVEVVTRQDRSVPVCELRGELDASNVDTVQRQLFECVGNDVPGLVLDLTQTTYLDSAGVRILFDLARRLRTHRQELRLVVPPDGVVRRVLVLTALADVVPLDEKVDDAVRTLRARI